MFANTQEAFFFQKCLQSSMGAFFVHDYLLTLPREVEVVWSKLFRVSTLVYFSTRYLPGVIIPYALVKSPMKDYDHILPFMIVLTYIIARVCITATLITRIYIISTYHRHIVTYCVGLWGLSSLIFEIFTLFRHNAEKYLFATVATRLSFEMVVVILTIIQSLRQFSFRQVFDGTTLVGFFVTNDPTHVTSRPLLIHYYFYSAVVALEITCIVSMTQIRPQDVLRESTGAFPLPVAGSLISRFHLSVRDIRDKPNEESDELRQMSSIKFADNPDDRGHEGNST